MIDPSKYQSEFEAKARNIGWPEEVINQVKVEISESGFGFSYPENVQDLIMNLEYGNFETPPKAAMRNFQARTGKETASLVVEKLIKDGLKGSVLD